MFSFERFAMRRLLEEGVSCTDTPFLLVAINNENKVPLFSYNLS